LSEVTATITGSAMSSLAYIKFDFLETILVPGTVLNEETIFRTVVVHGCVPLLTICLGFLHMVLLHKNKYSAAGGFKRMN
jgi:quinol-cytochrome oxidoreductase complex cytochrome b subunit